MKFALYSDLHLEVKPWTPPELDVDVVILAGDIGIHTRGLAWAGKTFEQPVIYVAGNHEYYEAQLGMLAELKKPAQERSHCKTACKTFQISGVISVQKLPP